MDLNVSENIISLSLVGNEIESLEGLERFPKLESLNISQNKIKKIIKLDSLKNLKTLNLSENEIDVIENLEHLPNLEELILFANRIADIDGLNSLKKLNILRLDFNDIKEIRNLGELKDLEILGLSYNKITDIKNLESLVNLLELNLAQNEISQIVGLENNQNLLKLYLYSNNLSNLEGLSQLSNLEILYIFDNKIERLSGIENLKNLKTLILNDNFIKKIEGLDDLKNLERLELGRNKISNIEGLDSLKKLKVFVLNDNRLIDIKGLENLKSLEYLGMSKNGIKSIDGLLELKNLKGLYLNNNNLIGISKIQKLVNLKELSLQNNKITKCDSFISMNLEKLDLRNNDIYYSTEFLKIPNIPNFDINYEDILMIKDTDISQFKDKLDNLLSRAKFFINTPSRELKKEFLIEIINIYNMKILLTVDIDRKISLFNELEPYFLQRIELERDGSDSSIFLKGLIELIKSTITSDYEIQKEHIFKTKEFYVKLRSMVYAESIDRTLLLLYTFDSMNNNKFNDFRFYMSLVTDLLYKKGLDFNILRNLNYLSLSPNLQYFNVIIHRQISHFLKHLKSLFKESLLTDAEISFPGDSKMQRKYNELNIEVITLAEVVDKLEEIRIYFANVDLRRRYYNADGTISGDLKQDIISWIQSELVEAKNENANLILFPEYCFPSDILSSIKNFSDENNIWIIGGFERFDSKDYSVNKNENCVFIFIPDQRPIIQKKNFPGKDEPYLISSKNLKILNSSFGSFTVLICADFLEDIICLKLKERVDFIVVPAFNRDVNTFEHRAEDKCLSNFSYIFMENIKKYGGSGIFAPLRGDRKITLSTPPIYKINLSEFRLHRNRDQSSDKYKRLIRDTLKN